MSANVLTQAPPGKTAVTATIYAVEPDILVRMAIADYLRECGHRVFEASRTFATLSSMLAARTGLLFGSNEFRPAMFADWPIGPSLSLERPMGDQKNQDQRNPGYTDQEKKRDNERGQKPQESYEKDQASNPERRERQDRQFDPSHIQEDPTREATR